MSEVREECGLFGIFGVEDPAPLVYRGLFSLQHRGQEGAGIVVSDGQTVRSAKGQGLVGEVFDKNTIAALTGRMGIGHVRYSTTGGARMENVQPLVAECVDGIWAVAHNGNLVNAGDLRRRYQEEGAIFQTGTDSEVLIHLLADPVFRARPRRLASALAELKGSFAFLLLTRDCVMAARDPFGVRPLSIGRLGTGVVFASETCAFAQTGAEWVRDVLPGELVVVDSSGLHSSMFTERPEKRLAQCVFEMVYFARPDSMVFGENVHRVRMQLGARLAEEQPADADIVIPVPDSGNSAAMGFSRASGIPLDSGFIRNHYVGRTFIMPGQDQRAEGADLKLSVMSETVSGKRVVVVDDSIIRGTTARQRVRCLREAGAVEVHLRVSCPPTKFPCYYGIDFPTKKELAANSRTVDEVARHLEADTLGYLSMEGLLSPFKNKRDFCTACFSGEYVWDRGPARNAKTAFDSGVLALDFSGRSANRR